MTLQRAGRLARPGRVARRIPAIAAMLVFAGVDSRALDPASPLSTYLISRYTIEAGLPHNSVQSIVQSADGYIWIGTDEGLARFDGTRFHNYTHASSPLMESDAVLALVAEGSRVLIGTNGGGLLSCDRGRIEPAPGAPKTAVIRSIAPWGANGLALLASGQVISLRGGRSSRISFSGDPGAIAAAPGGLLCVAASAGVHCGMTPERAETVVSFKPPAPSVRALLVDRDRGVWVGLRGGGVLHYPWGSGVLNRRLLPGARVRDLIQDRQGAIWIATENQGVARWRNGGLETIDVRNGLSTSFIKCVFEDRDGRIWLGTRGGGVNVLRDREVRAYTSANGLPSDVVRTVYEDAGGRIFAGTEGGGLSILAGGRFVRYQASSPIEDQVVRAVLRDSRGRFWIGTQDAGAFLEADGRFLRYGASNGLGSNYIKCFFELRDGSILIGTSGGGVSVWNRGVLSRLPGSSQPGLEEVDAVLEDGSGALWVGTRNAGAFRYAQGQWRNYGTAHGLPHRSVRSFTEDSKRRIWVATQGGVALWTGDGFAAVRPEAGAPGRVFQIIEDGAGKLWLTGTQGVTRLDSEELMAAARGELEKVNPLTFATYEGMPSEECSTAAQPAGFRSRSGAIWIATAGGIAVIDPARVRTGSEHAAAYVTAVRAGGRELTGLDGLLRVDQNPGGITIEYAAIQFHAPERVRYWHKLEGIDRGWVPAGRDPVASYASLPPGHYRFLAVASPGAAMGEGPPAFVRIQVLPRFYQTWWFAMLAATILLLAAGAIHRGRTRILRQQFAAVLAERARVAREIHDTLMQGLTGIGLQLHALKAQGISGPGAAAGKIESLLNQVDDCLDEARRYVWDLRTPAAEQLGIVERLRRLAGRIGDSCQAKLIVQTSGDASRIPARVEDAILLIVREAVSNALQHSGAGRIRISLEAGAGSIRAVVSDDGRGFDLQATPPSHFGLQGMRERASEIGGELLIETSPGKGTKVTFEIPLAAGGATEA